MNKLTDTLELWLQEQINTACRGLFDRIDQLECEVRDLHRHIDHQASHINHFIDTNAAFVKRQTKLELRVEELEGRVKYLEACVDNQSSHINTIVNANLALTKRVEDLEAGRVQQPTISFTDRVCEVFDTEEFKTTVQELIHDWIADSDVVCSTDDVVRILEETTFNIRVR